jgi:hypothetical protein
VCSGAINLPLTSGAVTVTGTTVSAGDDAALYCTLPYAGFSPDVVYTLDVPARQAIAIDLTAATGSQLKPVFALRPPQACASDIDTAACTYAADPQMPGRSVLTLPAVDPGLYSLWVEGDSATQGDFSLRVTASPPAAQPANDWCSTSTPMLVAGYPTTGDTRAAGNDYVDDCGLPLGANGEVAPDVVYRFTLLATSSATITVTPDAQTGALFKPVVYVRAPNTCSGASGTTSLGCAAAADYGAPVSVSLSALPAGTYSVWVDGAGLSSGGFSIRIQ